MKKLKEKVLKTIIFLTVVSSILPFFCHELSAETINGHVIGINVWTEPISESDYMISSNTYYQSNAVVHCEFELDKAYLGWSNMGFRIKYQNYNTTNNQWSDSYKVWSGNYYVNGDRINIDVPIKWNSNIMGYYQPTYGLPNSDSFLDQITYTNQGNIVEIGSLSTLSDIFNVLNDINNAVSIDIYDELQTIVIDLGLSNQYLEIISNLRQWNIPIESYGFNISLINNNFEIKSFQNINYFNYPLFYIPANKTLLGFTVTSSDFTVIVYIDKSINDKQALEQIISITGNNFSYDFTSLSLFQNVGRCMRLDFHSTNGQSNVVYLKALQDIHIMGIFEGIPSNNFTTDFALLYGFNNRLLNNLNIIAQGTQRSNQSASDLEDNKSDFDDVADDVYNLENSFNTGLNNSLQNIDTSFDIGQQFNSKFLLAADWVRVQFNTITAENPFGTMLSFSLLLGVALLIIGKVLG